MKMIKFQETYSKFVILFLIIVILLIATNHLTGKLQIYNDYKLIPYLDGQKFTYGDNCVDKYYWNLSLEPNPIKKEFGDIHLKIKGTIYFLDSFTFHSIYFETVGNSTVIFGDTTQIILKNLK